MKYFIDLPMKMEPIVSSETSEIRTQTPGNYPKRNKLHLEHGESLKTSNVTSRILSSESLSLEYFASGTGKVLEMLRHLLLGMYLFLRV